MAISLRNSAKNNNSTTSSLTVTLTASVGDIIVVTVATEKTTSPIATVSSISDGQGNSYAQRFGSAGISSDPNFSTADGLEVWWAYCANALTAATITVTLSATIDDAVTIASCYQGFTGTAYQTAPWDTNGSLPATAINSTGTASFASVTGVSTTSTAGMLLGHHCTVRTDQPPSPPTGWTQIQQGLNNGAIRSCAGTLDNLSYSSAQSSQTFTTTSIQATSWIYCVDALTIPASGPPVLVADVGSYSLNGTAAGVLHGWMIAAGVGSYSLTGTAASMFVEIPLRPDADISDGTWTDQAGGSSLFAAIDEVTASDADYIISSINPQNDTCEIRLSDPIGTPAQPGKVRYRYWLSGSGAVTELRVRLLQGTTQIASWTHSGITTTPTDAVQTLSSGEFTSITDFTDLRLEFRANRTV